MTTIHQRNWKVLQLWWHFKQILQNSLPWVLPDTYITDWHTIQLIFEFACFTLSFSSHPRIVHSLKFSAFTGDKQFTNEKISNINSLHKSKILVLSTIPLLCWIWPGFKQKSSLFLPTKSWNDTNTCAPIFLKLLFPLGFSWWQDQSYSSANYMHCSAKLSVTVHNSHPQLFPLVRLSLAAEPQTFSLRVITWVRSFWAPM